MMADTNSERMIIRLLREIAFERGLEMRTAFTDWIVELRDHAGRQVRVFGYDFGVNSSSSADIARDKSATSYLLREKEVSCIEHRIVFRPDYSKYSGQQSVFQTAFQAFEDFGQDVVCKDNKGTGGALVFRATSWNAVEEALGSIFEVHHACAISPFLTIENEIRVILVDGYPTAIFMKQRPTVLGDGKSNIAMLVAQQVPNLLGLGPRDIPLERWLYVPRSGETVVTNWRHNLGQGGSPVFDIENGIRNDAIELAHAAVNALGLRAASVDVVVTEMGLSVLEVNSGVMVENLARSSELGRQLALDTYRRIIDALLSHG